MKVGDNSTVDLSYCLNVHPGETWEDCLRTICGDALEVRRLVAADQPFGLGLRLGAAAADELLAGGRLEELKRVLDDNKLYVFTVNGFPYGPFHGTPVKEKVYRPDWREAERLSYSLALGRIMADLLPEGQTGSISTVPGSYGAWIESDEDQAQIVKNLTAAALAYWRLYRETGRELVLALEPEPDCYLETSPQTISFFKERVWRQGTTHLVRDEGMTRGHAEELLQRFLGVCFDTCHLSLQYEDLTASLLAMVREGVRIGKVQVSAALQTRGDEAGRDALRDFDDPVYLHQVRIRHADGTVDRYADLPEALSSGKGGSAEQWRVHCHVPLTFEGYGPVASTADELTEAFFQTALKEDVTQFETETYTFAVLPQAVQADGLVPTLAGELQWARHLLTGCPVVISQQTVAFLPRVW